MGGVSVNARVDARGDLFRRQAAVKKALKAKVGALESPWDFSALHAELDVICPLADNDGVLWCASCGGRCCGCSWSWSWSWS
jgi:hypothetical protein